MSNKTNILIIILVLVLCALGVVMVYSASCYNAEKSLGSSTYFMTKQLIGFGIGIVAMFILSRVDYHFFAKFYVLALVLGICLLVLVLIPGIGVSSYGARRWIGFGAFSFQASEVSKFCFILFCAGYMSKNKDKMTTFFGVLPVLCAGLVMCVLIMLEPNMSVTICVAVVTAVMLFVGGMRLKHLALTAVPAFCAVPLLIFME